MLIAGGLMTAALAAALLAGRVRVPALLLFLAIGMMIGTDGLAWIDFTDYELARDIGIIALALILYEGGLSTRVEELRPVAGAAASLALVGTLLTAVVTGLAATWLFNLSLLEGLLLGSIVASTDVAAIFAMLRGSGLKPRLTQILEGEAGANDPVAILLVIGFIEWIQSPGYGAIDMLGLFGMQLGIGIATGLLIGFFTARTLGRLEFPSVGLYPVASLTAGAITFGAADVLGGSGFLAIYLTGLILSGSAIPARRSVVAFHGGLAWVAQLSLFLTLGLLVNTGELGSILVEGTLLAIILTFVARPLASVVATAFVPLRLTERVVLGWAGLRGAVPVVLATFPVIAGVAGSAEFFNIVFFAVVLSLLLQGPTFEALARRLGETTAEPPPPEPLVEVGTIRGLGAEVVEYPVAADHAAAGALVRDLGLPREAVVNVIVRDGEALPPRGSTRIEAGDRLHVLVRREVAGEIAELMSLWRHGPLGPPPRPPRRLRGSSPIFTVRPCLARDITGRPERPEAIMDEPVVAQLRNRHDRTGALVALADGRYAVTGPLLIVGSRDDLIGYSRRRVRQSTGAEQSWFQGVIGSLAIDFSE